MLMMSDSLPSMSILLHVRLAEIVEARFEQERQRRRTVDLQRDLRRAEGAEIELIAVPQHEARRYVRFARTSSAHCASFFSQNIWILRLFVESNTASILTGARRLRGGRPNATRDTTGVRRRSATATGAKSTSRRRAGVARVEAVVQPRRAALPELDRVGHEAVAAPMRRARRVVAVAFADGLFLRFERRAAVDHRTLLRRPCADARAERARREIAVTFFCAGFLDPAFDAHLRSSRSSRTAARPLGARQDRAPCGFRNW